MEQSTTNSTWHDTPVICRCGGRMVSDGKSLPWCPDCLVQMNLYDLLHWLIEPMESYPIDPEIEAEKMALASLDAEPFQGVRYENAMAH